MSLAPGIGRLLRQAGGLTAAEAVAAAEVQMAGTRQEILTTVDAALQGIHRIGVAADHAELLYRRADEVACLAGLCGLQRVGEAAYSLCELVARLRHCGQWNEDAVLVHLDGMRVLRQYSDDAPAMLGALRRVVDRFART